MELPETLGRKETDGKLRWDLLPWEPVQEIVKVYTLGVEKYDDWNWYQGLPPSKLFGALMRHITKYWIYGLTWNVEVVKEKEYITHHLAHAAFYLLAFMQFDFEGRSSALEDRPWILRQKEGGV